MVNKRQKNRIVVLTLPQGTTLRTISDALSEEYVRALLANLSQCEREMGDAIVMLGLNGDPRLPDYSIWVVMDPETGEGYHYCAYSGKTHRPLTHKKYLDNLWSDQVMTWREVSTLLGELRKYKLPAAQVPQPPPQSA